MDNRHDPPGYQHGHTFEEQSPPPRGVTRELKIACYILGVVLFGASNRIAAKILSKPMGSYNQVIALYSSIGYVITYYSILAVRVQLGFVDRAQALIPWGWSIPLHAQKSPDDHPELQRGFAGVLSRLPPIALFGLMGLCDCIGNIMGMAATPFVPAALTALTPQVIVVFSMLSSLIVMNIRYTFWQCCAAFTVVCGAILTVIHSFLDAHTLNMKEMLYVLVLALSTLPSAFSFSIKELIFHLAHIDVFAVNSAGSLWQFGFSFLILPMSAYFAKDVTSCQTAAQYVERGMQCSVGKTPYVNCSVPVNDTLFAIPDRWYFAAGDASCHTGLLYQQLDDSPQDCSSMPWPFVIYFSSNILFNVFIIVLLKNASALQSFLAIKAVLPLSVILFLFDWPLIGKDTGSMNAYLIVGFGLILVGLLAFRFATHLKKPHHGCCFPCGNDSREPDSERYPLVNGRVVDSKSIQERL